MKAYKALEIMRLCHDLDSVVIDELLVVVWERYKIPKLYVMAEESVQLGSAQVRKIVHVGRRVGDAWSGQVSRGALIPALSPVLHKDLGRG
ncbi:hypothetical protein B296_00031645 [Ensete ventricosum]|uniref:Uncharacterized protein n=1 Tax=Ensete ventricosum TaxID=4639 RepID=A0A426YIZ9_ENSVE|nr:hypothetical protein B296_00031645 [Ensete ventricosum]